MNESKITLTESNGLWPNHAVEDIMNARAILECESTSLMFAPILGYQIPIDVYVSPKIYAVLIYQKLMNTDVSYKDFFERHNLAKIKVDDELDDLTALVSYKNDAVQINLDSSNQTIPKEAS